MFWLVPEPCSNTRRIDQTNVGNAYGDQVVPERTGSIIGLFIVVINQVQRHLQRVV